MLRAVDAPSAWRRCGPWLAALLILILGADAVYRAGPKERTDLPVYLAGSERVLAGQDPLLVESSRGWPYVYPPTLAVFLTPLTKLPLRVAAGLWFLVSTFVALGGWWLWRRSGASPLQGPLGWRDALVWALVALPAISALLRGQVGPPLLGLLLAAAACLAREREGPAFAPLGGALIALATAIKLTPGFVLVGLLAARRWRALAGAAAGLILWLVLVPLPLLGPRGTGAALEHFTQHMVLRPLRDPGERDLTSRNVHIGNNQSLVSLTVRHDPGPAGKAALGLIALGLLGAALGLSARGERAQASQAPAHHHPGAAGYALLIAAPLLLAPIAWHHHHVLLLPALAWLAARPPGPLGAAARAGLGLFALFSLLHFAVKPLRLGGLLGSGTLLVFALVVALRLAPGGGDDRGS
ncbi:MAG TPA: hypothetical protein DEA08_15765 [Planctomycetes bacterium]|nr:hypothetical protein [Planctomycetota bacterium]